jgi:hypothetical protein
MASLTLLQGGWMMWPSNFSPIEPGSLNGFLGGLFSALGSSVWHSKGKQKAERLEGYRLLAWKYSEGSTTTLALS